MQFYKGWATEWVQSDLFDFSHNHSYNFTTIRSDTTYKQCILKWKHSFLPNSYKMDLEPPITEASCEHDVSWSLLTVCIQDLILTVYYNSMLGLKFLAGDRYCVQPESDCRLILILIYTLYTI